MNSFNRQLRVNFYDQYIAGQSWKCEKSPTGAHNWLVVTGKQTCKHCGMVKIIERTVPANHRFMGGLSKPKIDSKVKEEKNGIS